VILTRIKSSLMMISWWSKHVGVILSVLMCDIWISVSLHTSSLVGPLHIVNLNARWNSEIGYSWNLIFGYFSKICREISILDKIWHEKWVFDMKTNIHVWLHLIEFFVEWEMFQSNFLKKITIHILYAVNFPKIVTFWDKVEKFGRDRHVTYDNIVRRLC
jgi:hypothetical protein